MKEKLTKSESGKLGAAATKIWAANKKEERINLYNLRPVFCAQCNFALNYKSRHNKFCSKSCSVKFNNLKRGPHTNERKENMVRSRNAFHIEKTKNTEVLGRYSKIYFKKCEICNANIVVNNKSHKFCNIHIASDIMRQPFLFKFKLEDYPELFNLEYIKTVGWYNPKEKSDKNKKFKLSKDHKVSINEAIENGYNAYYISHPLNCEILSFDENVRKKTKSSMKYEDLVKAVDLYDSGLAQ